MAVKGKENRTIYFSISEKDYKNFENDNSVAHIVINEALKKNPNSFPSDILEKGYKLNGKDRKSKKMNICLRRIKIGNHVYRICPSFVIPGMRGKVSEVEKVLFLAKFGVPFWALAVVFGKNAMYWYRLFVSLGQYNLVGTTVYDTSEMPTDILADEFHTRLCGVKTYIATIIAKGCFLGMEACKQANELSLTNAYNVFKQEVQRFISDYQPITINADGWWATQNALSSLFPKTKIVECFLHGFIKIRDRATKKVIVYYEQIADKVWNIYRTQSKQQMAQQIRRLKEWTLKNVPACPMKENVLKLCNKKKKWLAHFDAPSAYRTSAQLDRVMKKMERHAINSQMFHSNIEMTTLNFRAFALINNFSPSCPQVTKSTGTLSSPAARLNGFVLSDSWLENLYLAAFQASFKKQRKTL